LCFGDIFLFLVLFESLALDGVVVEGFEEVFDLIDFVFVGCYEVTEGKQFIKEHVVSD
jgi:hypothetical protein